MTTRPQSSLRDLARAGAEALRAGDAARARVLFERVAATGRADASIWLGVALSCAALGDHAARLAALDRTLSLDPRNLRALVLKADHYAGAGDSRAAAAHYAAAVRGFEAGRPGSRFEQSLDLLAGRKQVYVQQPLYYYFPGLPQVQFYERGDFPWLDAVEAATDDIRAEPRRSCSHCCDPGPAFRLTTA